MQSSLQLYESEFERAYKIMKKIQKGKLQMEDLLASYECFMSGDAKIIPDTGYHFVIVIQIMTSQESSGSTDKERIKYYHQKLTMTVESKLRSLLVHLDSILNPVRQSLGGQQEFQCLIRPYTKPKQTVSD